VSPSPENRTSPTPTARYDLWLVAKTGCHTEKSDHPLMTEPAMTNKTSPLWLIATLLTATPPSVSADTYSCQRPGGIRFASSEPCPSGSSTINVITAPRPIAADYASDAKQQSDAQRYRDNPPPSKMEIQPWQSNQPYNQPHSQPPTNRVAPAENKTQACERNWEAVRSIDAAARANSTDYLRMERQRLLDERWKIGC
jgi:hypothetical protein